MPVAHEELAELTIEVSVLGHQQAIASVSEILIGMHGLTIEADGKRGLLLPQVAAEHGWDAATFVSHVCAKAGLPIDAWAWPGARLESFTAQVFDENSHARARS
jgi:uncharacterized protein (TIGR00296 family)